MANFFFSQHIKYFLSRVNDYIILYYRAYGNFYHIGENLFHKISSVAGMSEVFVQQNFRPYITFVITVL